MSRSNDVYVASRDSDSKNIFPKCLSGKHITPIALGNLDSSSESILFFRELPFNMQRQIQSNWCWAAVPVSVGLYFNTGFWTQCDVADKQLKRATCCRFPGPCNVYGYLDQALMYTRSLANFYTNLMKMSEIKAQIDARCPICLRCAWYGGGAHFLAIIGYNPVTENISVTDSIYGNSIQSFSLFPFSYNGGGNWTHTYLTRKN
ncbi:papain-like cysteine protease family protein [Photorhabdus sp. SF281]|uniref:papain-like cysteine protease family protein n=1 Tax=Photorhabdus sp. SF281 TaxID=3459527 RepID=UPI0040443C27